MNELLRRCCACLAAGVLLLGSCASAGNSPGAARHNAGLQSFAETFFRWRAETQPCAPDDILRVERPDDWVPEVSPGELSKQQQMLREFRRALEHLSRAGWSRSDSVDYLLLRSAIERVNWELNVLKVPFVNPDFYAQQTLGAVYELLVVSSPMTERRTRNIIRRLQSIPSTLRSARVNLHNAIGPFARMAMVNLSDARPKLEKMASALHGVIKTQYQRPLDDAVDSASTAIETFVRSLTEDLPSMSPRFSVGKEAYRYYLRTIALIPLTPEDMLRMGRTEFERAAFCESTESIRNATLPAMPIFSGISEQIEQSRRDERAIRSFLEERSILSMPSSLHHYINRPTPPWVEPLSHMGVVDDLTSEKRLDEDGVAYIPPPSSALSFFRLASAKDPRPIIIHEGVPGHYFQLCVSWANEDPIRRRYFDSGPIEGFGFYVEEMLLQAGLFDNDRPRTRETIYRFMRLRSLRVEADIRLALGDFTIPQAGAFLERTVPMDRQTALEEAAFFASTPGQAISYQIGKTQIVSFLSDARRQQGDQFHLRKFHDYLAENGNVPIALLRWEYLGLRDEVESLWPTEGN